MSKRKALSLKTRFEVFKRDRFTCQYCGKSSPEAILQADHIVPVAQGGDNSLLNLVTSCFDCNMGKKANSLSDNAVLQKQETEMAELLEKAQEIQAIAKIRNEIKNLDKQIASFVNGQLHDLTSGKYSYSEHGIKKVLTLVKKYGLDEFTTCLSEAFNQYYEDNGATDTFDHANNMIPKIARCRELEKSKPYIRKLFYIRGIGRNRFHYFNEWQALDLMEKAHLSGLSLPEIERITIESKNWTEWRNCLEHYLEGE